MRSRVELYDLNLRVLGCVIPEGRLRDYGSVARRETVKRIIRRLLIEA